MNILNLKYCLVFFNIDFISKIKKMQTSLIAINLIYYMVVIPMDLKLAVCFLLFI